MIATACGQSIYFNQPGCGIRPLYAPSRGQNEMIPDPRVVGGNASVVGDHCWMVQMLYNGRFSCGGSIISRYVSLCAAHCMSSLTASFYTMVRAHVRVGAVGPAEQWDQSNPVAQVIRHTSYSSSTFNNDIGLFVQRDAWKFDGKYVCAICLCTFRAAERARCIATGMGTTSSGGALPSSLREAYMEVTTEAATNIYYGTSYNPVTMIPAAFPGDGLDTCQGDSGGPLSVQNPGKLNELCQIGITSWGRGCGDIGVYASVVNYHTWIHQQLVANNVPV